MNDNIVLIGFMGSGKTTFGKWISRKYGYSFCDTDEYIEKKEKTYIMNYKYWISRFHLLQNMYMKKQVVRCTKIRMLHI